MRIAENTTVCISTTTTYRSDFGDMMRTAELQRVLDRLWTVQDLVARTGKTPMTIHNWRAKGLPALIFRGYGRNGVRFVPKEVRAWAKKHKVEMQ